MLFSHFLGIIVLCCLISNILYILIFFFFFWLFEIGSYIWSLLLRFSPVHSLFCRKIEKAVALQGIMHVCILSFWVCMFSPMAKICKYIISKQFKFYWLYKLELHVNIVLITQLASILLLDV